MKINWISIRNSIIKYLKGESVKLAFKTLFKSAAFGGIRLWLVKTIVNEFYDEIGEPIIKAAFVQAGYEYNKIEGNILVKRLEEAKHENNQTAYDNATDDIFK
jgi:hypothetical protein